MSQEVTVIGRRSSCQLQVPRAEVSRRHCEIRQRGQELQLRDLGSRNGTYLNGKPVTEAIIKPGDRLNVGPVTFVFQIDGKPEKIGSPQKLKIKGDSAKPGTDDLLGEELDASDELAELEDSGSL